MYLENKSLSKSFDLCISILEFKLDIGVLIKEKVKDLCISILEFKWNSTIWH